MSDLLSFVASGVNLALFAAAFLAVGLVVRRVWTGIRSR